MINYNTQFEDWSPYYNNDDIIPAEIGILYGNIKKLSELFCHKICNKIIKDCKECDKDIIVDFWDKYDPEIIGVIPKKIDIPTQKKTIFRFDLGWCYGTDLIEFWQKIKEDILPFV